MASSRPVANFATLVLMGRNESFGESVSNGDGHPGGNSDVIYCT
jgi:hypothetical protein